MRYLLALFLIISASTLAAEQPVKIIWTAVFSNITPRMASVTKDYCVKHTPTVVVTTIDQITSKDGVKAMNGIHVKYLSYNSKAKDGLLFNTVNAIVSGEDKNGKWSTPMKMYQQTLSEQDRGVTWVVWSTKDCKGSFLGTPTVIQK